MAISRIGIETGNTDNGPSVVLNVPAGTVDDDVIVLLVSCDGTSGYTTPAGFTLQGTQQTLNTHTNQVFTKVASGEPSSYTLTPTSNERSWCCFATYRGASITTVIDSIDVSSTGSSGSNSVIPAFTPITDNCQVIVFEGHANGNNGSGIMTSWAGSFVEVVDNLNGPPGAGNASSAGAFADQLQTTAVDVAGTNVISDNSDWGIIVFALSDGIPPVIGIDTYDSTLGNSETGSIITGFGFGNPQATGLLELVENSNNTGTRITQTVNSWNDTTINFDVVSGALANTNAYLVVTNDDGDVKLVAVQIGLPPETYQEALEALSPVFQHYWTFQNTYGDEVGGATANNASGGTPTFSTTPICKGDTHSLLLDSTTDYISCADQSDMNTSSSANRRMMAGWIMMDRVTQAVSVIWEEGAQVNNYAWLIGFGNSLMIQFADDGGDYVQIYFPVTLKPNRPYHVYMEFNGSGQNSGICRGLLDGIPNVLSNGNPWEVANFPSHSGNISWGHEGVENLQVGDSRGVDNVDIAFASPVACHYAHFISLQNEEYTDTQIRVEMFEKGALQTVTIAGGTQAAMQTAVDAQADTLFADAPCAIEVGVCTDGDFALDFDNITFEDRVSVEVRYVGADTLTISANGTTIIDPTKVSTPYGGTLIVNKPATLTLTDLTNPTEVRVFIAGTETEIGGQEAVTSGTFLTSVEVASVDIAILALNYQNLKLEGIDTSADITLPIQQVTDRQYQND